MKFHTNRRETACLSGILYEKSYKTHPACERLPGMTICRFHRHHSPDVHAFTATVYDYTRSACCAERRSMAACSRSHTSSMASLFIR